MHVKVAVLSLALAASAFGGSIVTNGGFETGDLTGWTVNSGVGDPWAITTSPNTGSFNVTNGCVGDVCINGTPDVQNFLSQSLTTVAGQTYTLSFWYDPGDVGEGGTSELVAQWDGTTVQDLVLVGTGDCGEDCANAFDQTTPGVGYNLYTASGLTASTSSTVLSFLGRQDPSFSNLDDISVTADQSSVPEPSSYVMAVGGLVALGVAKLRKK